MTAKATDSVGNTNTATNGFTYNTTVPSVTVTYPVNATTYGPNWSGTLTGTSASNAGSGTSISSVALTIENTTTQLLERHHVPGQLTSVNASGTTGWSYSLAASALTNGNAYSVTAKATDSVGNTNTGHQYLHLLDGRPHGRHHLPGGVDQLRGDGHEEQRLRLHVPQAPPAA